MKPRKPIPRRRKTARRKRPELFPPVKPDPWPAISQRVRLKWWDESTSSGKALLCGICHNLILWFRDLVPDHIKPGKMGGCKDHSESNLQPAHWWCNLKKGSKRIPLVEAK